MSGRKVFTAGEVLQAADVNDFLMDQSVMVFAGTAARGSAIPSPTEGMVTYRSDDDVVEVYNGASFVPVGPGQILQVVSTAKTDTFSTTSGTYVDVTGLSATITPSSTSSKILVSVESYAGHSTNTVTSIALLRDSTIINSADGFNYYHRSNFGIDANAREINYAIPVNFLDAPATTSATTYKLQIRTDGGTAFINRAGVASTVATVSSITLMEVAG